MNIKHGREVRVFPLFISCISIIHLMKCWSNWLGIRLIEGTDEQVIASNFCLLKDLVSHQDLRKSHSVIYIDSWRTIWPKFPWQLFTDKVWVGRPTVFQLRGRTISFRWLLGCSCSGKFWMEWCIDNFLKIVFASTFAHTPIGAIHSSTNHKIILWKIRCRSASFLASKIWPIRCATW